MSGIAIANAPCSFGAFEVTIGILANVPEGLTLLDAVAEAGYAGIDLGPVGYLGAGDELRERLAARNLLLAGGYLPLAFSEPDVLASQLDTIDALCDTLDAAPQGTPKARPTLADAGSPQRAALPGRAARDRSVGLDDAGWKRFADGMARVLERFRARGYEPTFHHHTATYVEAAWEIDRMLEMTDVGVTLDTGHLLVGGGDPVACLRDWGKRVNHIHLKDAHLDVVAGIVADAAPVDEIWKRRAFCALGEGDVDMDGFLEAVRAVDYEGWLVVEQDIFPRADEPVSVAAQAQVANLGYLRERGF